MRRRDLDLDHDRAAVVRELRAAREARTSVVLVGYDGNEIARGEVGPINAVEVVLSTPPTDHGNRGGARRVDLDHVAAVRPCRSIVLTRTARAAAKGES